MYELHRFRLGVANQNQSNHNSQSDERKRLQQANHMSKKKNKWTVQSAGKRGWPSRDWFLFWIWLVKRVTHWKTIHKDKQNGGIFGCSAHLAYLWYILPFLSKPLASLINLQCAGVVFLSLLAEFWLHRHSFQLSVPESQREEIKLYVKAAWIGKIHRQELRRKAKRASFSQFI